MLIPLTGNIYNICRNLLRLKRINSCLSKEIKNIIFITPYLQHSKLVTSFRIVKIQSHYFLIRIYIQRSLVILPVFHHFGSTYTLVYDAWTQLSFVHVITVHYANFRTSITIMYSYLHFFYSTAAKLYEFRRYLRIRHRGILNLEL